MQHLGELVLTFLNRELQPSCQLACLETIRILSRDKHCLDPFISHSAMSTLARYAGIAMAGAATPADSQQVESQGNSCQLSQVSPGFYHKRRFLSCSFVPPMKLPRIPLYSLLSLSLQEEVQFYALSFFLFVCFTLKSTVIVLVLFL